MTAGTRQYVDYIMPIAVLRKSVAAYQHNILFHPAYLLSFLGAGPGIRDLGWIGGGVRIRDKIPDPQQWSLTQKVDQNRL